MKQRILCSATAVLLVLALLCSLIACGDTYREVKSSSAWRKTVVKLDGQPVSFELLRFFFFRRATEVDGGDETRFSGTDGDSLLQETLKLAVRDVCDIYAVFDICRVWGQDPDDDEIDALVDEYVRLSVDGGYVGSTYVAGFGGDYDAYLKDLSTLHSTDTVSRLLYRYTACLSTLYTYVAINGAEGKATVTDDELRAFLMGDDCVRANYAYLQKVATTRAEAEDFHDRMLAVKGNAAKLAELVTPYNLTEDPHSGLYYGRYATDADDAARYEAIFSLHAGEVSDLIEDEDGYYIYYGMEKDPSLLEDDIQKADFSALYWEEALYRAMAARAEELLACLTYEPLYEKLTYEKLSEAS